MVGDMTHISQASHNLIYNNTICNTTIGLHITGSSANDANDCMGNVIKNNISGEAACIISSLNTVARTTERWVRKRLPVQWIWCSRGQFYRLGDQELSTRRMPHGKPQRVIVAQRAALIPCRPTPNS